MIVRLRMDAALSEPAQNRLHPLGRPRKKGKRLPTLEKVAEDKRTRWKGLTVREWYGEKKRTTKITFGTAVWSHRGQPAVPIRWVIVRDPKRKLPCAPLSTFPPRTSFHGFPDDGKSKSPSTKLERISAWKPKDSGQAFPFCGLLKLCSVCSLWLPCPPMRMPAKIRSRSSKRLGTPGSCLLFRMHSVL